MTPIMVAHRGLWSPHVSRQNTLEACHLALMAGFGIEIDVRWSTLQGEFLLSHDPLVPVRSYPSLASLLETTASTTLPILVNIKEAGHEQGLATQLHAVTEKFASLFVFDFELCGADHAPFEALQVPTLKRRSDRPEPDLKVPEYGYWWDQWDSDWVKDEDLYQIGPHFIVAPDLHGRCFDLRALDQWRRARGICTDIPHLVQRVLDDGDPHVYPIRPWWNP